MEHEKKEEHVHHGHAQHSHHHSVIKKFGTYHAFIALSFLLGILLLFNLFTTSDLNSQIGKNLEAAKEKARPAKIDVVALRDSKCSGCFDTSKVLAYIKSANVNVTGEKSLEFDSKEGKELVRRYGISKVPALIVTGEIEKAGLQGMEKRENALVLANVGAPYTNTATGRIEGKVALYLLRDFGCSECSNLSVLLSQIKGSGVIISEEKAIGTLTDEGKELAKKYNIGFAPALILSKDASAYPIMQQAWSRIGSVESDGSYVLRSASPPFVNLTTGKLMGLVSIIYLADKSCPECYDVNLHRQILASPQSFAIKFSREETDDISDSKGKEMIAKYNITKAPTVIISGEAGVYPSSQALKQFFSVENDGSYIFRKPEVLGAYKDLASNEVVKAQQGQ